MSKWDEKYRAAPEGLFGCLPNEYVREVAARSDFAARTGLCLADGDGRNSRWLASQGIAMTAVDLSGVACENGRALDQVAGVSVKRIVADLETWQPQAGRSWQSCFLMYLQAPLPVRKAALAAGWSALEPGGWLVHEGFSKAQAGGDLGPGKADLMYSLEEIGEALPGVEIVEALSGKVRLAEGDRHEGVAEVVRFSGRKPV